MARFHPIPLISLSLCAACPPAADPVGTDATGPGSGTDGASETGAPTSTAPGSTTTAGESPSTATTATTADGDTTTTGTPADTSTGATTTLEDPTTSTSESCPNSGGAPPGPDNMQCEAGSCGPESVCLRTISCDLVSAPCDGLCLRETSPTECVPIPEQCKGRPGELEACLEQEFLLCDYGGEYEDGLLDCDYVFDQCNEGSGYTYPSC